MHGDFPVHDKGHRVLQCSPEPLLYSIARFLQASNSPVTSLYVKSSTRLIAGSLLCLLSRNPNQQTGGRIINLGTCPQNSISLAAVYSNILDQSPRWTAPEATCRMQSSRSTRNIERKREIQINQVPLFGTGQEIILRRRSSSMRYNHLRRRRQTSTLLINSTRKSKSNMSKRVMKHMHIYPSTRGKSLRDNWTCPPSRLHMQLSTDMQLGMTFSSLLLARCALLPVGPLCL